MEVYEKIIEDFTVVFLLYIAITIVLTVFRIGYDSTDGDSRSGMSLHIDNKTGCHYLGGVSLIPRLDASGKHICIGHEEN